MKNISEKELRRRIANMLKENYFDNFDDFDFDNDAMDAARKDIEDEGGNFENLGTSKFEKKPTFGDELKSDLNRANLELPSDEEEIENLAKILKARKAHEDQFGKGSLNETDNVILDAGGKPLKLKSPVKHESGTNGYVERFILGDDGTMKVKINWIQDPMEEKLPSIVSSSDVMIRETILVQPDTSYDNTEEMEELDENGSRSHLVGRGENLKPEDYPEELMRESFIEKVSAKIKGISPKQMAYNKEHNLPLDWNGTKEGYHEFKTNKKHTSGTNESTDYNYAAEEREYEDKAAFEEDLDKEVYYVVDNDFNNVNYPDLVGKTFETPPSYAQVKVVKLGDVAYGDMDEGDNLTLTNKHGENLKPSNLKEFEDESDRYERVIFFQDHEATNALNILKQDGVDDAMEYLIQWHQPGNHETSNEIGKGSQDKTYERDGYIMSWNPSLDYIGLTYDTQSNNLEEDSQRKRHSAGQIGKVAKNIPLGNNSPHSDSALGL